jgi:SAM-dependent methyltransferase
MDWNKLLHGTRGRLPLNTRIDTVINNLQSGEGYCVDMGSAYAPEQLKKAVRAHGYKYVGLEIRRTRGTVQGDITLMPFSDDSVSLILCTDVIEHLDHWAMPIPAIFHVLKPKGYLYLHFPIYFVTGESKHIKPDQWGHQWQISVDDVIESLINYSFDILRVLLKFDTGDALIIATKK